MRRIGRKQEHVAFSDGFALPLALTIYVLEDNVPFDLEEELVGRIDVEIPPGIRTPNGHDHEFGVLPDHFGTHGGFQ